MHDGNVICRGGSGMPWRRFDDQRKIHALPIAVVIARVRREVGITKKKEEVVLNGEVLTTAFRLEHERTTVGPEHAIKYGDFLPLGFRVAVFRIKTRPRLQSKRLRIFPRNGF